MASEVKADKLSPSTGTSLQIGDASDTITIPTGATFTITDGLGVAGGGTGLTSFTAGDVLYATGTTTLAKLAKGTAEQVLAMNSGATAPDWGSVDLTVLPTITAVKGGTGQTSFTAGDIFYANSTTTITKLGKGTARQGLQTNSGATAPEWTNSPQSLMTAEGDILYASGANTLAKLAKGSDDEVLTLASGVPSWAAAAGGGKINQVITVVQPDTVSTNATSWTDMTGMTATITPSATSSKILWSFNISTLGSISQSGHIQIVYGDDSALTTNAVGTAYGSRTVCTTGGIYQGSGEWSDSKSMQGLDAPNTTSATTYKLQWFLSSGYQYLNRRTTDTDNATFDRSMSTITLMEVLV